MEIKINKAIIKDAQSIACIQRDAWLQTYPNKKAKITLDDIKYRFSNMEKKYERWKECLKNKKRNELILVAKNDNQTVGFCIATKSKIENNITAIYVSPNFQAKGIGKLLMQKALIWLGEKKDISVLVAEYNINAIMFYKKFGFVDTGERIKEEFLKMKSGNYIFESKFILPKRLDK